MSIPRKSIDWANSSFLVGTHLAAAAGTLIYSLFVGWTWAAVALYVFFATTTGLSITAGYHRLFSHRTYRAHWIVRFLYLFFGAGAYQNSALKWSDDHRRHHQRVDEEEDPYNIKKGFWHAHILWIFFKDNAPPDPQGLPDLTADPLVMWQHRWYIPLSILVGFVLPLAGGWALGDPLGGLIVAGVLRIVIMHHAAFCVNSLAHTIGRQPYSNSDSSRDSAITAIATLGEGYHNFHHTFPYDYRNGLLPHQFDPTKWLIGGLGFLRLATDLRRAPLESIVKARLRMDELRVPDPDRLRVFREKLEALAERWQRLKEEYARVKRELGRRAQASLDALKAEIRQVRREFQQAWRVWRAALVAAPS